MERNGDHRNGRGLRRLWLARPQRLLIIALLVGLAAGAATALTGSARAGAAGETPPNFKVAFIGDQGINSNAEAVLNLIADEGADMVLHQGDFAQADGSETDPQTAINWDAQITSILGDDFPYFASIGNHDVGNWPTYQQLLLERLARVPGATCSGDYGVQSACSYQGLFFILSGIGIDPWVPDYGPHVDYIAGQLANDGSIWRICSWHMNQTAMQVGIGNDLIGWGAYEECRKAGAIIATGHEHSYHRTRTLGNTEFQIVHPVWPEPDLLQVGKNSTFVIVSGLGGASIRDQDRCLPTTPPYGCRGEWASIYTSDQGANYGALFIEFNVDDDPGKAVGYFKDIDGVIADSFTVVVAPPKQAAPGDTDGDGCTDEQENGPDEMLGGRRDYLNPWDYFNPTGDRQNRVDDILAVVNHYFLNEGDEGYDENYDRTYLGPNEWNLGPPDGMIRVGDVIHAVKMYYHDCS